MPGPDEPCARRVDREVAAGEDRGAEPAAEALARAEERREAGGTGGLGPARFATLTGS
jgi:hypothetical protein